MFGYAGFSGHRSSAHAGASIGRGAYYIRRRVQFTGLLPKAFGGQPAFGGVQRDATSSPSEVVADVWAQWSMTGRIGKWSLAPGAGVRYARYSRGAWTEQGADSLSLSAPASSIGAMHADVGVRATRAAGRFRPNVSLLYRRELTSLPVTMVQLSDRVEGLFALTGANLTADHLTSRAGVAYSLAGDVALSLAYELRHARDQARQTLRFGIEF